MTAAVSRPGLTSLAAAELSPPLSGFCWALTDGRRLEATTRRCEAAAGRCWDLASFKEFGARKEAIIV